MPEYVKAVPVAPGEPVVGEVRPASYASAFDERSQSLRPRYAVTDGPLYSANDQPMDAVRRFVPTRFAREGITHPAAPWYRNGKPVVERPVVQVGEFSSYVDREVAGNAAASDSATQREEIVASLRPRYFIVAPDGREVILREEADVLVAEEVDRIGKHVVELGFGGAPRLDSHVAQLRSRLYDQIARRHTIIDSL